MKIQNVVVGAVIVAGFTIHSVQADTIIIGVSDRMDTLRDSMYNSEISGYAYESEPGRTVLSIASLKMPQNGACTKHVQIKFSTVVYDGNPWGNTEDASRGYIDITKSDINYVHYSFSSYKDYNGDRQEYEYCQQSGSIMLSSEDVPEGIYKIDVQDPDTHATHNVKYVLFGQVDLQITQGGEFLSVYGSTISSNTQYDKNVTSCSAEYRDVSTGETLWSGDAYYGGYDYDDGEGYGYCNDNRDISSIIFTDPDDSSNVTVSEIEVVLTAVLSDNSTEEHIGRVTLK